jgi:transposase
MMLLTRPNTLSEQQCRELEELKKTTKEVKLYRRAKVILYRNSGYTPDEIEEHTDYSEREQRYLVRRYRKEGVAGLADRPRSGRPKGTGRRRGAPSAGETDTSHDMASDSSQAPAQEETNAPAPMPTQETSEEEEEEEEKKKKKKKKKGIALSLWARLTLESMYAYHPKRYLRQRAHMVLLRDKGYSPDEIADILEVTVRTVGHICTRYDRHQLAGLYRQLGSGRPSRLQAERWEQFAKWVKDGPKALGYRFVIWTTRSLRKYIFKRFNIKFSREWIRQKLHHFVGYSWTRGKKVYAYPEDQKRNADRRTFSQKMLTYLERARNGDIILLFEDESIFTLFGEVGHSWSPQGKTLEVPSVGKRGRVVVFGAVDPIAGRPHYHLTKKNIDQDSSLHFLTHLVRYYEKRAPGIPLVIVWDKHPGHTAGVVTEFVNTLPHVTLEKTPTQSPDLNPIERIWDWLADLMIKNDFFERLDALKRAIRHFFCYIAGIQEQVLTCLGDLQKLYSEEVKVDAKI